MSILVEKSAKDIVAHLDAMALYVEQCILTGRLPELILSQRQSELENNTQTRKHATTSKKRRRTIKYGSHQFEVLLATISFVYEALKTSKTITKRDIYYRDVPLFVSQKAVDDSLSLLTAHLGIERHQLNVRAAAKGLIRGPLQITMQDGSTIDCASHNHLIADPEDYASFDLGHCAAILVVEKEAIFQSLTSYSFHNDESFQCLLITGKGYPDLYTRRFLHLLATYMDSSADHIVRNTPVLCLVDCDPHGIEIMTIYKYGSKSMAEENTNLTVPRLKWLGLHSSEWSIASQGVLPFDKHDIQQLETLYSRDYFSGRNLNRAWRDELDRMRVRRMKAEIEVLSNSHEGLGAFLRGKIRNNQWL